MQEKICVLRHIPQVKDANKDKSTSQHYFSLTCWTPTPKTHSEKKYFIEGVKCNNLHWFASRSLLQFDILHQIQAIYNPSHFGIKVHLFFSTDSNLQIVFHQSFQDCLENFKSLLDIVERDVTVVNVAAREVVEALNNMHLNHVWINSASVHSSHASSCPLVYAKTFRALEGIPMALWFWNG